MSVPVEFPFNVFEFPNATFDEIDPPPALRLTPLKVAADTLPEVTIFPLVFTVVTDPLPNCMVLLVPVLAPLPKAVELVTPLPTPLPFPMATLLDPD